MPSIAILRKVKQLYSVSDRLDSLAEQYPVVSEALITTSGSVRNSVGRNSAEWKQEDTKWPVFRRKHFATARA